VCAERPLRGGVLGRRRKGWLQSGWLQWGWFGTALVAAWLAAQSAWANPAADAEVSRVLDRVVVRFTAPELGGVNSPSFVFERELAFEARLEALTDPRFTPSANEPYLAVHVRAALERHVAEAILESLRMTPPPTQAEIEARVTAAEASLAIEVGGATALGQAARAEGIEQREVYRLLQRRARASLYLDRMVAPMLSPSEAELQALHNSGRTPFSRVPYNEAAVEMRRWYVSRALRQAVQAYYDGARTRITMTIL
jgi:hypothetical protein